jgi:hypothetical protein
MKGFRFEAGPAGHSAGGDGRSGWAGPAGQAPIVGVYRLALSWGRIIRVSKQLALARPARPARPHSPRAIWSPTPGVIIRTPARPYAALWDSRNRSGQLGPPRGLRPPTEACRPVGRKPGASVAPGHRAVSRAPKSIIPTTESQPYAAGYTSELSSEPVRGAVSRFNGGVSQ